MTSEAPKSDIPQDDEVLVESTEIVDADVLAELLNEEDWIKQLLSENDGKDNQILSEGEFPTNQDSVKTDKEEENEPPKPALTIPPPTVRVPVYSDDLAVEVDLLSENTREYRMECLAIAMISADVRLTALWNDDCRIADSERREINPIEWIASHKKLKSK